MKPSLELEDKSEDKSENKSENKSESEHNSVPETTEPTTESVPVASSSTEVTFSPTAALSPISPVSQNTIILPLALPSTQTVLIVTMAAPPTMAELQGLIQTMIQQQTTLTNTVTDMTNNMSTNKGVSKPQNYDGKRSDEARCFLASFALWARGIPALMADDRKLIKSAISFLEGDAAIWATPISENISNVAENIPGITLLHPNWNLFQNAFKGRFEMVDAIADAKQLLKLLWQGRDTVATYVFTFKQYPSQTGYLDSNLRDCFYNHLADRIKNALAFSNRNTSALEHLIDECILIDNRQTQRARERNSQNISFNNFPNSGVGRTFPNPLAPTSFTPSRRDPNAMDVDATNTNWTANEYQRFMVGKYYGCGSKSHRKSEGHHEQDVCNHCRLTGHLANVCRRKFLGLSRPTARTLSATLDFAVMQIFRVHQ
ncbi:hypothetical protein D9757_002091 [Collybiopsis confluens]|uniref:Retrotransposon gag domain-containing protein n=1 Tax=Collybiopsis confluens TaxID=2823264 RepID=A0A8H5I072_9AGAR|nr:hypothetical protein D9757_002091 [Collybiopsis confluens]